MKNKTLGLFLLLLPVKILWAQQSDAAYGFGVKGIYLKAQLGVISYDYDHSLLAEGVTVSSVTATTTFAGKFAFGYHLNKNLDVQLSVLRPAAWASYNKVSTDLSDKSVWTNIWAVSGLYHFPISGRFSAFAEAGLSNVARHGYEVNGRPILRDAQYLYPIFGTGMEYSLSEKWKLSLAATYSPPRSKSDQPATTFLGAGFSFSPKEPDSSIIARNDQSKYHFPKQALRFSYTTDVLGFDINRQFSGGLKTSIPIFWNGDVFVEKGLFVDYQRTVFHTYKHFSLHVGASFATYDTRGGGSFYALSIFPVVRYWFLRTDLVDVYFNYSVIGPAYISKSRLDGIDTGEEATFQDFMGFGFLFGKNKKWLLDLKIAHYSNGNIFNDNPGIAIPLTVGLGMPLY